MTESIMQELNARVDIDKEEPADVAADYLKNFGFVAS
jgi:glycine betaine/choline ABC-type transport system substrate-binding protein